MTILSLFGDPISDRACHSPMSHAYDENPRQLLQIRSDLLLGEVPVGRWDGNRQPKAWIVASQEHRSAIYIYLYVPWFQTDSTFTSFGVVLGDALQSCMFKPAVGDMPSICVWSVRRMICTVYTAAKESHGYVCLPHGIWFVSTYSALAHFFLLYLRHYMRLINLETCSGLFDNLMCSN